MTEDLAAAIRRHVLTMTAKAGASHVGSALSISDILAVLYGQILKVDASAPKDPQRDRFILSKGHACAAVYATLAELGYFDPNELSLYGADHSKFMTHISSRVNGVEFSTGSLGHGLPFGVGKALAAKRRAESWRTYVLLSDGEMDEGSNWEALMFAAHHKLDNLIAIIDYNKLQSLASVQETLNLEPLVGKLNAFGWSVREVDGHDHAGLSRQLLAAPWEPEKPSVLVAHTTKGKGVSFMEGKVEWHYRSLSPEQLSDALAELR